MAKKKSTMKRVTDAVKKRVIRPVGKALGLTGAAKKGKPKKAAARKSTARKSGVKKKAAR